MAARAKDGAAGAKAGSLRGVDPPAVAIKIKGETAWPSSQSCGNMQSCGN